MTHEEVLFELMQFNIGVGLVSGVVMRSPGWDSPGVIAASMG